MDVRLRPANQDDADDVIRLLHDLYRGDLGPGFSGILHEYFCRENHLVLIAASAGRPVGVLVGSYRLDMDYECRAGFIDAVVVHEDFRGKGIGRRLLTEFARWAAARGCTVLQVLNGKREFFEAAGFAERPAVLHQLATVNLTS
jgi:GNAT superfamily N-acetyltransferase